MNAEKVAAFRERLLQKQADLEREIQDVDDARVQQIHSPGDIPDQSTHPADQDSEGVDTELALDRSLKDQLRAVNTALERTRSGTYGVCAACGKDITLKRLDAIPYTPYCIDCERAAEAEFAGE